MNTYFEIKIYKTILLNFLLFDIWTKENLNKIIQNLEKCRYQKRNFGCMDFENLKECDSSAIIYLISFIKRFSKDSVFLKNSQNYQKFILL